MQDNMYNQENEISLVDLFLMIKKYFLFLVFFTLLGGALAAIYAFGIAPKTYQSDIEIMVNGQHQSIKDFYLSDYLLRRVILNLDLNMNIDDLREDLEITFVTSSKYMDISLQVDGRNQSRIILTEIIAVGQDLISNHPNYVSYQNLITYPLSPSIEYRVGPNYVLVIFIGMILSGMVSLGYVFVREMMFPRYQDPKTLEKQLDIDCLGVIPVYQKHGGEKHA